MNVEYFKMIRPWKRIALSAGLLSARKKNAIGMDNGSRFIKSVILEAGKSSPQLKELVIEPVNQDPSGDLSTETTTESKIFGNSRTPPLHSVGIAVSGPQVWLKTLMLPGMSEKDLREHLTLETDRYIPLDVQDVVWDVYWHKDSSYFTGRKQQYFLIVARKDFIKERMQVFENQNLKIHFVDVDAFALVNMVTYNYGKGGTWLIIHLGPSGILSVGIKDGNPVYIHQMSFGAEWYGELVDTILSNEMSEEGDKLGVSENLLLEQFFKETSDQIKESVEHFFYSLESVAMPDVFLSGGYSVVEGFSERIAESLKRPVRVIDPFKKIVVPSAIQQNSEFQKALPLFGVAVGVALRGVITRD